MSNTQGKEVKGPTHQPQSQGLAMPALPRSRETFAAEQRSRRGWVKGRQSPKKPTYCRHIGLTSSRMAQYCSGYNITSHWRLLLFFLTFGKCVDMLSSDLISSSREPKFQSETRMQCQKIAAGSRLTGHPVILSLSAEQLNGTLRLEVNVRCLLHRDDPFKTFKSLQRRIESI